jgi:hypothetical protein
MRNRHQHAQITKPWEGNVPNYFTSLPASYQSTLVHLGLLSGGIEGLSYKVSGGIGNISRKATAVHAVKASNLNHATT